MSTGNSRSLPLALFVKALPRQLFRIASGLAVVLLTVGATTSALYGQTFSVLYTFKYGTDGGTTNGGLVQDSAGNLYGVAEVGGDLSCKYGSTGFLGCGVVFKVTPSGEETVLYNFRGGSDGAGPAATLIRDSAGNFYGTTFEGGDPACSFGEGSGCGTIFKLDASGKETVLYRFHNGNDGAAPGGALYRDGSGNLWGTAQFGGNSSCLPSGCGTIFRLDSGGHFKSHPLVQATEGSWPMGGMIADSHGNMFGTTQFDGPHRGGTVFRLDPTHGGLDVVHAFDVNTDGGGLTGLLFSDGKLWGPTTGGGPEGGGTVWSLDPKGIDILFSFYNPRDSSVFMSGVMARDPQGNLYGTSAFDGDQGTIYEVAADGTQTVLHYFEGADGQNPMSGLIRDSQGNLFGTTLNGSTVFKLTP
jgi:uncharacterized repeat protein (TIGR03803 family)